MPKHIAKFPSQYVMQLDSSQQLQQKFNTIHRQSIHQYFNLKTGTTLKHHKIR